jgi:hypothetical protein
LTRFKEKIRQDITGIGNYPCLETIARQRRAPPSHEFQPVDTIRLEVSTMAGKELFAKPGHRFEDRDVTSLVNSGAIGSGMFSMVVRNLFVTRGTLRYRREENLAGQHTVRYDFRLTRQESGFRLHVANISEMVAAKGSFWFDPVSLDLIRIEIHGEGIPDDRHIDEAVVRIDYARGRIGDSDALLPKRSELTMNFFNGVAYRDVIGLSVPRVQCRIEHRAAQVINVNSAIGETRQSKLLAIRTECQAMPRSVHLQGTGERRRRRRHLPEADLDAVCRPDVPRSLIPKKSGGELRARRQENDVTRPGT